MTLAPAVRVQRRIRAATELWRAPGATSLVVGGCLVAVAVGLAVVVGSVGAQRTGELGFDIALAHHRDFAGIGIAEWFATLVGPVAGPVIAAGAVVVTWRRSRLAAALLLALTAAGALAALLLMLLTRRPRPPQDAVRSVVATSGQDGFPSLGVALIAAAVASVAMVLWLLDGRSRRLWWVTAAGSGLIVAVGISELYLGMHYALDVLAAPLIGVGTVLVLGHLVARPMTRRTGRTSARQARRPGHETTEVGGRWTPS